MNNTEPLKVGDRVIHKLTCQRMTIKSISETVASCVLDKPEPFVLMGTIYPNDIVIVSVDNLNIMI